MAMNDLLNAIGKADPSGRVRKKDIISPGGTMVYEVMQDVTVDSINTEKHKQILIKGSGVLTIKAGYLQPCIGQLTHTNMSYGRWEPSNSNYLETIIIDGVSVVFVPDRDSFSIGAYNYETYPEVKLLNGGTLTGCPEMGGKRVLARKAFPPDGSTKIDMIPTYKVVLIGTDESQYYSNDILLFMDYLRGIGRNDLVDVVNIYTTEKAAEHAKIILEMNRNADVKAMIDGKHNRHLFIVECACVLGLNPEMTEDTQEIIFESLKYDILRKRYKEYDTAPEGSPAEIVISTIARNMYSGKAYGELTEWERKYMYEMIPSYCWNFNDYANNDEATEAFYNLSV